jgi:hypothetical protein
MPDFFTPAKWSEFPAAGKPQQGGATGGADEGGGDQGVAKAGGAFFASYWFSVLDCSFTGEGETGFDLTAGAGGGV